MLIYNLLSIGFIFSLIANFTHKDEETLNSFFVSLITYSIFFCIAKINFSLANLTASFSTTPIILLLIISLFSLLIYQYLQTDIHWYDRVQSIVKEVSC